jgi:DHA1 family tetracycline resistance protein-like MFS transporter
MGGLLGSINPRLPFFAAAGLALSNFAFGLFFLKESLSPENRRPFDWRKANAISSLKALRGQSPTVLWFVAALGTWQLAHVVYPSVWPYFAIAAYGFSVRDVGLALAMVGFSSALVQGLGLRWALPKLGERRAVILGVTGLCASAILYNLAHVHWQVYVAIAVGALQGFVQPPIAAFNSRAVDARSQGELQGAVQSIGSIAAIVGPPMYTQALARFSGPNAIIDLPGMPMLISAGISLITLALFLKGASLLEREG